MTNLESVYRVKEPLRQTSDDASIPNRFIYSTLLSIRKELLKQELDKSKLWDGTAADTIICFPFRRVSSQGCCKNPFRETVLRSVYPLPKVIDSSFGKGLIGIFTFAGDKVLPVSKSKLSARKNIRERPTGISAEIENDHILIWDYDSDELFTTVQAFFEDPQDVYTINSACSQDTVSNPSCEPFYNQEFSLPGYLERRLFLMASAEIARALSIPEDTENNNREDLQNINPKQFVNGQ